MGMPYVFIVLFFVFLNNTWNSAWNTVGTQY